MPLSGRSIREAPARGAFPVTSRTIRAPSPMARRSPWSSRSCARSSVHPCRSIVTSGAIRPVASLRSHDPSSVASFGFALATRAAAGSETRRIIESGALLCLGEITASERLASICAPLACAPRVGRTLAATRRHSAASSALRRRLGGKAGQRALGQQQKSGAARSHAPGRQPGVIPRAPECIEAV
jgi:hypothetical protein